MDGRTGQRIISAGGGLRKEGTRMNWSRGLFRVWMVLSVAWIVFIGWKYLYDVDQSNPAFLESRERLRISIEASAMRERGASLAEISDYMTSQGVLPNGEFRQIRYAFVKRPE